MTVKIMIMIRFIMVMSIDRVDGDYNDVDEGFVMMR